MVQYYLMLFQACTEAVNDVCDAMIFIAFFRKNTYMKRNALSEATHSLRIFARLLTPCLLKTLKSRTAETINSFPLHNAQSSVQNWLRYFSASEIQSFVETRYYY